jgi:hypothetical protein
MRRIGLWLGLALVGASATLGLAKAPGDLVVHEWGTFLVMQGGDGVTLDGMYHEEHALPAFVHSRAKDQLRLTSVFVKGETPVIYFYSDRRQNVNVEVGFPQGIWTQWYPQASTVGPSLAATGSPPQLKNGHIEWDAEVVPAAEMPAGAIVPAAAKGALWNYSRDVDAAYVKVRTAGSGSTARFEHERFLFYRGLGRATLPLEMTSESGGTLRLAEAGAVPLKHLFVIRVENGKAGYRYVPSLSVGETLNGVIPPLPRCVSPAQFDAQITKDLESRLVESGLYEREARAMVNTWRTSYFGADGIRVLFVLPQSWTDRFIPMRLSPQPQQLVRVMVGRLELLTPEREKRVQEAVRGLADAKTSEASFRVLREQGRYVEPIVRRVERTTTDEKVRTLCRRLLLTDFVTELRASVNSAVDGGRLREDPMQVRAQLASLLREIGLVEEAKAEAAPVLASLRAMPVPPMNQSGTRRYLRARARAEEAAGNEAGAVEWYGRFIRFGSQVKQCGACHETEGPREMTWFKDWWAGRKFADAVARTGQSAALIAQNEAALARDPHDTSAQMQLAYLYERRGDRSRAGQMWARVLGPENGKQARR